MTGITDSLTGLIPVAVAGVITLTIAERAFQNKALDGESIRKKSKATAKYITVSQTKGERCSNCEFWEGNGVCQVVQGKITPEGRSKFYVEK